MSDDSENKSPTPPPVEALPETGSSSWKLPEGFENQIEEGIIKVAAGVVIGGVLGLAFARTGKGGRLGFLCAGAGAGLGSAYERALQSFNAN